MEPKSVTVHVESAQISLSGKTAYQLVTYLEQIASRITSEWPTTSDLALLLFAFQRFANCEQEDGTLILCVR